MHYSTDSVSVCEHALVCSRLPGLCSLACATVSTMKITAEGPVFHPHHQSQLKPGLSSHSSSDHPVSQVVFGVQAHIISSISSIVFPVCFVTYLVFPVVRNPPRSPASCPRQLDSLPSITVLHRPASSPSLPAPPHRPAPSYPSPEVPWLLSPCTRRSHRTATPPLESTAPALTGLTAPPRPPLQSLSAALD